MNKKGNDIVTIQEILRWITNILTKLEKKSYDVPLKL